MNTNIKITLTDEEREVLAGRWFDRKALVSRKEVNEFIQTQLQVALNGLAPQVDTAFNDDATGPPERTDERKPESRRDQRVPDFMPSRGDESYLYTPKDPELATACSVVLNGLENIEKYVWDTLERNRA